MPSWLALRRGLSAVDEDRISAGGETSVGREQWGSRAKGAGGSLVRSAKRQRGFFEPFDAARHALDDFQQGPKIQRPNLAQSFIPVVGPAWEAAADLQDGNYGGAAINSAMAIADALPVGVALKGVRAASKGITILKKGSLTANAAAKQLRARGLARKGEEIHHSFPLNGISRTAQDWRNHYAFLKVLRKDRHRRLTGSWEGKPQYDPIRRLWHGTTDWQKAVPAGVTGVGVDTWENLTRPFTFPSDRDGPGDDW